MQRNLALLSSMQRAPENAPASLVRRIETPAQALAVAIKMSGFKLAFFAASMGKSEGYLSRLRSGKRPIPETMIEPLCWLTGTNLLRQFLDLQEALQDAEQVMTERDKVRRLADELRNAA